MLYRKIVIQFYLMSCIVVAGHISPPVIESGHNSQKHFVKKKGVWLYWNRSTVEQIFYNHMIKVMMFFLLFIALYVWLWFVLYLGATPRWAWQKKKKNCNKMTKTLKSFSTTSFSIKVHKIFFDDQDYFVKVSFSFNYNKWRFGW